MLHQSLVKCIKCGSILLVVFMYLFIGMYCVNVILLSSPPGAKSSIKPWNLESWVASSGERLQQLQEQRYPLLPVVVHRVLFCVQTMVRLPVFGIFTQMLMHVIAHGGCADTVIESALEVDSGRKVPMSHQGIKLSALCLLLRPTLYLLSYPSTILMPPLGLGAVWLLKTKTKKMKCWDHKMALEIRSNDVLIKKCHLKGHSTHSWSVDKNKGNLNYSDREKEGKTWRQQKWQQNEGRDE